MIEMIAHAPLSTIIIDIMTETAIKTQTTVLSSLSFSLVSPFDGLVLAVIDAPQQSTFDGLVLAAIAAPIAPTIPFDGLVVAAIAAPIAPTITL
jgi:hypothetical protein